MPLDLFRYYGPLLRLLPAEAAHDITIRALAGGFAPRHPPPPPPALVTTCFGLELPNPFGMAAGFDKNAEAIEPLLRWGFGFVEVGTVTPRPQSGNSKPRLFRLPADAAVINRMGFNNDGLAAVTARLGRFRAGSLGRGVVAVNIGKNRDTSDAAADYVAAARATAPWADFLVVNVSSPNTPGLRALQSRDALAELLGRVHTALGALDRAPPLCLKIAPDLTEQDRRDIAEVAVATPVAGLVVSNTTVARPSGLAGRHRGESGGLSGRPLFAPSTELLREMFARTGGKLTFIGVGGVASGIEAYAKIRAGATLVQLYTALIYEGPALLRRICEELAELLARDGFATVLDAVGADHR